MPRLVFFGRVVKLRTVLELFLVGIAGVSLLSSCVPFIPEARLPRVRRPGFMSTISPAPQYYSPLENAEYVSTGATIIVRYGPLLNDGDIDGLAFTVQGARSGVHMGQTILADDHKTVIFKPYDPFTPGEDVSVNVNSLLLEDGTVYPALSYSFTVAKNQQPGTAGSSQLSNPPIPAKPPRSAFPDFLTVPQDIPHFVMSGASPDPAEGYLFVAPFYWTESTVGSYLLILNAQGQLVYYKSAADALDAWDFKPLPDGRLSYYSQKDSTIYLMDSHYQTIDTYQAGDGYSADLHDFQILPNGDALLMIYDAETVDMSKIVLGGQPDAQVTGLVIQELDPSRNVIFEWRSWDHFSYWDSTVKLTDQTIDLIHGNSLALTTDGNLLLSSRNLSEITKIDLQTGNILWRFGGKANMFTFVGGEPFAYQHDVRQLSNGNITVFDNHAPTYSPAPSRGVEYQLDEANRTATQVWEYTPAVPVYSTYMGNTERLSDGNTLLSWGAPYTKSGYKYLSITEVASDNSPLFSLTFDQPYVSYRAFLSPWHGSPDTLPDLAYKISGRYTILGYSWNGATDVAGFRLYGGTSLAALDPIEARARTDFEVQSRLSDLPANECYFQVAALGRGGAELARSKIISTNQLFCPTPP